MCAPTKNASTVSQFNKRFYLWIYLAADYEFEFLTGTNSVSATDTELYVKYQGTEGELIFYFDGSGSVFSIGGTDTYLILMDPKHVVTLISMEIPGSTIFIAWKS